MTKKASNKKSNYPDVPPVDELRSRVGVLVFKTSERPFKSGRKVNTVKGVSMHPVTDRPCYTFEEDDSYVEVRMCQCWTPECGVPRHPTILKAIQYLGDIISNPGGDFAPPALAVLHELFTTEQLDEVEKELAALSEDDLELWCDDDDDVRPMVSELADKVLSEGFEAIETAYDRGMIEGVN